MPKNTLVINCDIRETRVALIEEGVIAELQIERAGARGTVGNIVLGRVTRVLPGMQAAFIDVGMERAAFLHVEDLIRPDDLDAYLAGGRRNAEDDRWQKGEGSKRKDQAAVAGAAVEEEDEDDDEDDDDDDEDAPLVTTVSSDPVNELPKPLLEDDEDDDDDDDDDDDAPEDDVATDDDVAADDDAAADDDDDAADDDAAEDDVAADEDDDDDDDDDEDDDDDQEEEEEEEEEEGEERDIDDDEEDVTVAGEAPSTEADGQRADANGRRRRRRRRRRGRDGDSGSSPTPGAAAAVPAVRQRSAPVAAASGGRQRSGRDGDRGRSNERSRQGGRREGKSGRGQNRSSSSSSKGGIPRVSRSVPITEVVKEGDEVIVQISKEPIGTKGARVTSHVSLAGRYVVYLPTVEHVGVSKRIGSSRERARLREVVEAMKPASGGIIVRTVAEGLTKKNLKADIGYLVRLWEDVLRKREGAKAPSVLYTELDLVLKTARDLFTDEIESIVIDDKTEYARLVRFVEMFLPGRVKDIHYYSGDEPIFDAYGIEDEISRALSRKVPLPSGGYLIIDQAEALTAIDVNTGRFVGKGSKDLEETALKTNLEAVDEIAYQLRFRNIGGLVILDLIDMDGPSNREKVWRALEQRLAKDKAKTTINRISELGLIEMTRKRTRESLARTMHETCFYCDGTGQIQSRTTIGYEILRQIRRERHTLQGYSVVVNAHPAVVDLMTGEEREAVVEAERRYMRRIEFNPRREYHIEQFDLLGK
jgi:ribonuclease G